MAEPKNYIFEFKEVAEALVKQQGLHEGIWGLYLEFGLQGANINLPPAGQDTENIIPAAIVPVMKIGLQRFDKLNQLSVDAAKVNPAPKLRPKKKIEKSS